jgi:hypothetical protein
MKIFSKYTIVVFILEEGLALSYFIHYHHFMGRNADDIFIIDRVGLIK